MGGRPQESESGVDIEASGLKHWSPVTFAVGH